MGVYGTKIHFDKRKPSRESILACVEKRTGLTCTLTREAIRFSIGCEALPSIVTFHRMGDVLSLHMENGSGYFFDECKESLIELGGTHRGELVFDDSIGDYAKDSTGKYLHRDRSTAKATVQWQNLPLGMRLWHKYSGVRFLVAILIGIPLAFFRFLKKTLRTKKLAKH